MDLGLHHRRDDPGRRRRHPLDLATRSGRHCPGLPGQPGAAVG
jgi:hypothetical protein